MAQRRILCLPVQLAVRNGCNSTSTLLEKPKLRFHERFHCCPFQFNKQLNYYTIIDLLN